MAFPFRHLNACAALCATLWFSFAPLHVAAAAAPAAPDRSFSVLAAGEMDWAGFGVLDGSGFVPLSPARQRRSPPLGRPGAGAYVDFVFRSTDPTTGKPVDTPLARAAWPAGASRALFVLVPRAAAPGPGALEVLACDDGLEAFPPESVRVFNATRATFQGVLGAERMIFAPGASAPVRSTAFIPPDEDAPDPGMPVGLALAEPGGLRPLHAARMSVAPRARVLVVVSPPKNAGSSRVQVRAVHEVPPPERSRPSGE